MNVKAIAQELKKSSNLPDKALLEKAQEIHDYLAAQSAKEWSCAVPIENIICTDTEIRVTLANRVLVRFTPSLPTPIKEYPHGMINHAYYEKVFGKTAWFETD